MAAAVFTDENFETEVLQSDSPVLVDFWSPSCGPCRMIAPIIEELAGENAGTVKVGKMDVSEGQSTAMKYGIQAVPTLMIFKNGEPVQVMQGAREKAELQKAIDSATA